MTNEELQAHMKAIIDARNRGEIQESSLSGNSWAAPRGNGEVFVGSEHLKYRIKPEPRVAREFWVDPKPFGEYEHTHPAYTMKGCGNHTAGLIHVREVLPEDDQS